MRGQGRNPVEHEPRPDDGGGAAVEIEEAGRVAEVNLEGWRTVRDGFHQRVKKVELRAGEDGVFVGHRKVGAHSGEADAG